MDWSFWDVIWTTLVVFFWITFLIIFLNVVIDVFRSADLSGPKKALWLILLVVLPIVGTLIYVIARGKGMAERQAMRRADQVEGIRTTIAGAAANSTPVEQIAYAQQLLDGGVISQEEFETLKAKALA